MRVSAYFAFLSSLTLTNVVIADHHGADTQVKDDVIAKQRTELQNNTAGKGFGPQSPRDIDVITGKNPNLFSFAPAYSKMNLCNIHFHAGAEHKGGEFTRYAGNGDGKGYNSGYLYSGSLNKKQRMPLKNKAICSGKHGSLAVGDTIEAHYVFSSASVSPGPTLGSCLATKVTHNPQLRVEAQVYVLVNDSDAKALNFETLAAHAVRNGFHQALNIPANTGTPIEYRGSTTGPSFNTKGSPFQVTWSVRPKVAFVKATTVDAWCKSNTFNEGYAHGVRNLVVNPDLLSNN
ncbi:hypothetical protein CBF23_003900 [Marinomonas agarivorans]|nr:hypothetical protein CBF23_003900 [Marinomonas agarivorans]